MGCVFTGLSEPTQYCGDNGAHLTLCFTSSGCAPCYSLGCGEYFETLVASVTGALSISIVPSIYAMLKRR